MPRLILGCARLTGGASAGAAGALVRAALDAGVPHVDTAPSYGMGTAEIVVGKAIRRFGGQVAVTAKLGSARDPHAIAKSWLRRAKRALGSSRTGMWQNDQTPPARITAPSGNDFGARAMRASLDLSRERLGRIDYLLLHDISANEVTAPLLVELGALAASVSAAPGYASHAQWDSDLDGKFPPGKIAQCAMTPGWLIPGTAPVRLPLLLHSVIKAGASLRTRHADFSDSLERAARMVGTGDEDADRIAALYAAAATAAPLARLVIASSHRRRLQAVLRAITRIDNAGSAPDIAALFHDHALAGVVLK